MINGDVDIAVHSMKDVPPLPGSVAVLERANTLDILVPKEILIFLIMKVHCHRKFASSGEQLSQS
jgi:porphobilinogen deaminase